MKIAIAQINTKVGDLKGNAEKILTYAKHAQAAQADIVLFPEMTLPGYPIEDLMFYPDFMTDLLNEETHLSQNLSRLNVISVFGSISKTVWMNGFDQTGHGVEVENVAIVVGKGKVWGHSSKTELPNYGVFDEKRYFTSGQCRIFEILGKTIAVTICEDIWIPESVVRTKVRNSKADLVLNLSASPFYHKKLSVRTQVVQDFAKSVGAPVVYCNLVGGQDELVFDGGSMVVDAGGWSIEHLPRFEECMQVVDLDSRDHLRDLAAGFVYAPNPLEEVYQALVLGTRDYVRKSGFKSVVIGMSGGIDSALTAAIAKDALGAENVLCVTMPSQYNSQETRSDALKQAEVLGVRCEGVPIQDIFSVNMETLARYSLLPALRNSGGKEAKLTCENFQARIRGNILMAYSNATNRLVLSTGNKSELSVGYCTLYGDMCGGFNALKDVYKTTVFELCRYLNEREGKEVILESIINRPPSAELSEGQKDSDSLPPYEVLDAIIKGYIEGKSSIGALVRDYGLPDVKRVLTLLTRSEYKRRQGAPGVKITPVAFGKDRRMPIVNAYEWGEIR